MNTPEGRVKDKIRAVFDTMGIEYTMPIGSTYGGNGDPDFVGCYQGQFLAVEAKADGQLPTRLQTEKLERYYRAGGIALVIDKNNVAQLQGFIEERMDDHIPQDYYARAVDHWAARRAATKAADDGSGIRVR